MSKHASVRRNLNRFRALLITLILVVATNFAISVTLNGSSGKSVLNPVKPPIPKSVLNPVKPPIPRSVLNPVKPPIP